MPSFPRYTRIPNTFVADQTFTDAIKFVVNGIQIDVRPCWRVLVGGKVKVGWEMSRDDGQTWKDAGSITHGS